jgi:universal stress protein A
MSEYKKVLVAIDIHAEYENVINKALSIASSADDIHLVYITMTTYYVQPYLYGMSDHQIDQAGMVRQAQENIKDIATKFGIIPENTHVKSGEPADEIKNIAGEVHADLIVMGTHGRGGIKLLLGSTANAVLHGVKQDVLAVRMHD